MTPFETIEKLLLAKDYAALTAEERELVAEHIDSEEEYATMRQFYAVAPEAISTDATVPAPSPGVHSRLHNLWDAQHGNPDVGTRKTGLSVLLGFLFSAKHFGLKGAIIVTGLIGPYFMQTQHNPYTDPFQSDSAYYLSDTSQTDGDSSSVSYPTLVP